MKQPPDAKRWRVMRLAAGAAGEAMVLSGAAAFLVYAVGHGLAFLTQVAIARLLGAQHYGIYAYVFAWMTILAHMATMGFNVSLLRFVPTYAARNLWPLLAGAVRYAERRVIFAGLSMLACGSFLLLTLGSAGQQELRSTFLMGFLLVPIVSLLLVRCAVVRAYGGVVSALAPLRLIRDGVLLAVVCILWFMRNGWDGPHIVMMATVVASVLGLISATQAQNRLQPSPVMCAQPEYDAPTWRRAALPLLVIAVGESLLDKGGVLVLGLSGANREAGIFALIFSISMLVLVPRTAIDTVFAPRIARLHAQEKFPEVQALVIWASLLSFATAGCVVVTLVAIAGPLLSWFGPAFEAGETPLRILLIGQLFATASGSQVVVLAMTGNEAVAARSVVLSAILNLLMCTALVHQWGLLGASIGTVAAIIALNAIMAVNIWWKLRMWPGIAGILRNRM